MLFSFSSPSSHSSFPHLPPWFFSLNSLSTAMWLILELPNLFFVHHLIAVHICLCHSLIIPSIIVINLMYFVFLLNFSLPHTFFLPRPQHLSWSHSFYLWLISVLHRHPLHRPSFPPLTRLNSSSLLPPPLFCRAPVTPSGVTRTVSDSRRTCYLVTRL